MTYKDLIPLSVKIYICSKFEELLDFFTVLACEYFPINSNKIVFDNFYGKGFSDSCKCIAENLHLKHPKSSIFWVVREPCVQLPPCIHPLVVNTRSCRFHMSTAKVLVDNIKNGPFESKRKGQFYLQTWHGDFPLKHIEKECENILDAKYVERSKKDSLLTDAVLSGSSFFTRILKDSFWYTDNTKIVEYGIPRNDIYFAKKNNNKPIKTAIYAPTFRDDLTVSCYNLDCNLLWETLEKQTGEKWRIVVRLHPNVLGRDDVFEYNEHIINGTNFDDAQKLFADSDILITDISSLIKDFMLMRKPVFLYMSDFEHYKGTCRTLRPLFYKMPVKLCKTNNELIYEIKTFNFSEYLKKIEVFLNDYIGAYDNGNATDKVSDLIISVMEGLYDSNHDKQNLK